MSGLVALFRKQLTESRWLLVLSCAALFLLSWFSVYRTSGIEARMSGGEESRPGMGTAIFFARVGGPDMDMSSIALETTVLYILLFGLPLILTTIWSISRGTAAVAGDLERGSMDLILSRPVARSTYLSAQLLVALFGLALLAAAIVGGNLFGHQLHVVETPPAVIQVARPAANLAMIGVAILGYCTLLSSIDIVRWRPMLFGSVLTLAQFVTFAVANQPDWDEYEWLNRASVFSAFYPIESAVKGEKLAYNSMVLGGIGLGTLALSYLGFAYRDLPANS